MNIVYSSSDAYCECTCISLISLLENNFEIKSLNVYILSTDISEENKRYIESIAKKYKRKIVFIEAKDDFIDGATEFNLTLLRGAYNTYSRIMLNKWFNNLDKVIVIDSDTLVVGDISGMWNIDLNNNLIAAVPEIAVYSKHSTIEDSEIIENTGLYFNMGVVVVNLKEWRKRHINTYLLSKIKEDKKQNLVADQSIINRYLNSYIVRMDLRYNFYSPMHFTSYNAIRKTFCAKEVFEKNEIIESQKHPVIIHFYGHSYERPWFRHNASPYRKFYSFYRNLSKWKGVKRQKWKKAHSFIFNIYDLLCYILLKCHLYNFCLRFRYSFGQRVKRKIKLTR